MNCVRMRLSCLALCAGLACLAAGCSKRASNAPETTIEERLATSLHGTARGIEYWYESAQGGFENITGIPYDDLACKSCHVEPGNCSICHGSATSAAADIPEGTGKGGEGAGAPALPPQSDEDCYGCHGNQFVELLNGLSDYHRDVLGLTCSDCHESDEVHGDGASYNSLLEPGAMTTRCDNESCHGTVPSNDFHDQHAGDNPPGARMECAACHVQSVVTCYNCHFEYEVEKGQKLAFGHFKNWKFLLRRDRGGGQLNVDTGNILAVTYEGKAFVAVAPFYAHSISRTAISECGDCHNNEYVQEYKDTGVIVITAWDDQESALVPNVKGKGIIPIPPDWRTSLQFSFATFHDGGPEPPGWIEISPSEVDMQMLFAEPLSGLPE